MTDILEQSLAETVAPMARSSASSLPPDPATSYWAFINSWTVAPQSNDRPPVPATAIPSAAASPAAQRSTARREHQKMFKAWSQERNEQVS